MTSNTARVLDSGSSAVRGSLELDRVSISYQSSRDNREYQAVADITASVAAQEFACILGPSGCGKSSLLAAIAGLTPIAAGSIRIGGSEINGPGRDRAMVFQHASLFPWRTVLGNVRYGLELRGVKKREANSLCLKLIELVGLSGFERHYPYELSGGMQQRVNLARALSAGPDILLMDEPFAALDSQMRELMQLELLRIWTETKMSVVFVTHQVEEAIFLADQVLLMSKGPSSHVVKRVEVGFERPRQEKVKRSREFVGMVDDLWSELRRTSYTDSQPQIV